MLTVLVLILLVLAVLSAGMAALNRSAVNFNYLALAVFLYLLAQLILFMATWHPLVHLRAGV